MAYQQGFVRFLRLGLFHVTVPQWLPRARSVGPRRAFAGANPFRCCPSNSSPRPSPTGELGQGNAALIRLRHLLPQEKGMGEGELCPVDLAIRRLSMVERL